MKTKKIVLICTSVITALIVLSTFFFSLMVILLASQSDASNVPTELMIAFQEAIYIPIFSTYIGLFMFECWVHWRRKNNES